MLNFTLLGFAKTSLVILLSHPSFHSVFPSVPAPVEVPLTNSHFTGVLQDGCRAPFSQPLPSWGRHSLTFSSHHPRPQLPSLIRLFGATNQPFLSDCPVPHMKPGGSDRNNEVQQSTIGKLLEAFGSCARGKHVFIVKLCGNAFVKHFASFQAQIS